MTGDRTVWGIHMGTQHGNRPIEDGYIALGWFKMGDLKALSDDREAYKARYSQVYPHRKAGAVPVDAGTLFRFKCEMKVGDLVLYPSKGDRQVNFGEVTGPYEYHPPKP